MESLNWKDALWIGLFQALAVFPGISRSGSTIAGGLFKGYKRSDSARFSFLMSVPVMIAAGGLSLLDLFEMPNLAEFSAGFAGWFYHFSCSRLFINPLAPEILIPKVAESICYLLRAAFPDNCHLLLCGIKSYISV